MGAELGQTNDPMELVPGAPETIERNAEDLGRFGQRAGSVGDDLGKVDVASWTGEAYNKFFGRFVEEPPKWRDAGDALGTAKSHLTGHAETLRWAQSQAREAIAMWERGEAATKQAKEDHDKAVTAAAGGGSASPLQPFNDPGENIRQEAQELLNRARTQLSDAGTTAASAIQGLAGKLAPKNSSGDVQGKGPNAGWSWVNPKVAIDGAGKGMDKYGRNPAATPGFFSAGGGIKGYANLVEGKATGKTEIAGAKLSGTASGNIGASGTAFAGATSDGAKVALNAQLGAAGTAEGKANYGILGATAKGTAFAGAEGDAGVTVGKQGVDARAGAFAGAKAGGSLGGDIGGLGAGAAAEGWAGAGAEADVQIGKGDDGKWHIGGQAGVGLGLGGKVGGEITIDPPKIADTVGKAGKAIGGLF